MISESMWGTAPETPWKSLGGVEYEIDIEGRTAYDITCRINDTLRESNDD